MSRHAVLSLLTAILLGFAGCGDPEVVVEDPDSTEQDDDQQDDQQDDPQDDDPQDDEPTDFTDESAELTDSYCELALDCCSDDERTYDDEESCALAHAGLFGPTGEDLEEAQEEGRITVDADALETCQDSLSELTCDEFDGTDDQLEELEGCSDLIVPQVEEGEECSQSWECVSDFCNQDGECEQLPEAGDECSQNRCAAGYYCDRLPDECVEQKDAGEECGGDDECITGKCVSEEDEDPGQVSPGGATCQEPEPRCEG